MVVFLSKTNYKLNCSLSHKINRPQIIIIVWLIPLDDLWVTDQVCSVKMAGYWPRSFFACLWTKMKSRSINSQKKERGQYPAILTEQTWSIKDLLYGFWWNFACGVQRVVPSGQRWLHLARSGSQSQHAIWFILPACETSHIIKEVNACQLKLAFILIFKN